MMTPENRKNRLEGDLRAFSGISMFLVISGNWNQVEIQVITLGSPRLGIYVYCKPLCLKII